MARKQDKHTVDLAIMVVIIVVFYTQGTKVQAAVKSVAGGLTSGSGQLSNPVPGAAKTSGFGWRLDPVTHKTQLHAGQDFAVPSGTPIHAAAAGTVTKVIPVASSGGYGNYTCIDHGGGLSTCYAHQSVFKVSDGEHVERGEVIGLSGSTGEATGPHLHFEVRVNGKPVNPMGYLS